MTLSALRRLVLKGALACACASVFTLPAFAADDVLRVSAIPDEAPTELQRKFAPLGKYLEAQTGMKVVFTPVSDYAAVVESLATRKIDLAWLGGFTFVQAKIRTNGTAIPIVQRAEDAVFTSKFITADPNIKSVADLKGKTFAYSGAHDATVAFVAAGKAEAGVLNASVWDKLVEQKKVDTDKVRVFSTTPPYFDYNWTVRGDLDPALVKKLTDAFLKLDPANPEHKEILALQRASKFVPTKKENYEGIEKAAHSAGLLK